MYEKMYQDFVANVLPKINDGLVISKDYFTDLLGRYVKFLIWTDSLGIVLNLVLILVPIYFSYKFRKIIIEITDGGAFIFLGFLIVPMIFLFCGISDLIEDLTVPEVRIYNNFKK